MDLRDLGPHSGLLLGITLASYLVVITLVNAALDWWNRR